MTRTVTATIGLIDTDAATLAAPLAGYRLVATEAQGAVVTADLAIDATTASLSLDAGTWTAYVVAIDANANPLGQPVFADPLTVTDPVVVIVHLPHTLILSVA